MGGINHQPTTNASLRLTVPAAEALTEAMSQLMQGNVAIERLIQLTGEVHFGVGRARLIEAASCFEGVVTQLGITRSYVDRIVDTVGSREYVPFDLGAVNAASFIPECVAAGLLVDSAATTRATEVITTQGYTGMFFEICDMIDEASAAAQRLHEVTRTMVDGPEGTQGYFWTNVEANRNTWRQDFMVALVTMTNLIAFWATTAAACTEVHLKGVGAPSLLTRADVIS